PVAERPVSRLALSTAIFSAATGISRVLGLFREVVAKNYFGVHGPVNAFNIAFLVPNTIRALVADAALSSAFVPVFSDLLEPPARTPVAWNRVTIARLGSGVPRVDGTDAKLYVYAGAILVGTIVQVLLPMPWLRGLDGRLQMVIDWRDPAVKQVFKLMLPVTL